MSALHAAPPRARPGRIRALLALDGPVAMTSLAVFQYFVLSVSFLAAAALPAVAFQLLIGWQGTHLALWLGAVSTLPVAPATYALLRGARSTLTHKAEAHAVRTFWRAFADGCRTLWWAALAAAGIVLTLGYDIALYDASGAVLLFAAAAAAVAAVLLVAVSLVAASAPQARATAMVIVAARRICRRPHVALAWLLLIGLGVAATALPLVGPAVALFLPALVGVGIHICNDALRFHPHDETSQTP